MSRGHSLSTPRAFREKKRSSLYISREKGERVIDLFTDTAAILNYLDLRTIMECPGGISLPHRRFQGSSFFIPSQKRAPLKTPAWEAKAA